MADGSIIDVLMETCSNLLEYSNRLERSVAAHERTIAEMQRAYEALEQRVEEIEDAIQ